MQHAVPPTESTFCSCRIQCTRYSRHAPCCACRLRGNSRASYASARIQHSEPCRDKCEILFKHGIISEKCLYGTVGLGYNKQLDTTYKTRHYASQFDGDWKKGFCHVYPLMKTHKETEDNPFEQTLNGAVLDAFIRTEYTIPE